MTVRHITSGVDEVTLTSTLYNRTGDFEQTGIISPIVNRYSSNETLGADIDFPTKAGVSSDKGRKPLIGGLDNSFLKRAKDIIDSFDINDIIASTINLESLRGIVLQLWESATKGSQFHKEILATLESAILSVESPNESQLSAFKEAVMDLGNDILTQSHVDVIRRRFISEGFSPLALLSELKDADDND